MMTNKEFVAKAKDIATNYKTLYVMGCFGSPIKSSNVKRYTTNYAYNRQSKRTAMIKAAADKNPPVFGFDCVCLIKAILWGWNGDASKSYGGAVYESNDVPDINEAQMINRCSDLSTNFSDIEIGEAVWTTGHIGIYIGDGLAVECTPSWSNDVQITACNCSKTGYNRRDWKKHGKLPWIKYEKAESVKKDDTASFFPPHGYFRKGDVHPNVGKIASFMRKNFPAYTSEKALGNLYGTNLIKSITEFQRRTGLEADGCTGKLTLAMLERYGFKK